MCFDEPKILPEKKRIQVGTVSIGGGAPISIQSMTRIPTQKTPEVLKEIRELARHGAHLVRVAVPRKASLVGLDELVEKSPVPIIADVHYPLTLATEAVVRGVAGVRINPLTLEDSQALKGLIRILRKKQAAVRVGVNAGRLTPGQEADLDPLLDPLWEVADRLSQGGVENIKVSAKASDVSLNRRLNLGLAQKGSWPIHLGLTEAGVGIEGVVRSVAALGPLLSAGVGDTLRISLSGSPIQEVETAKYLLRSLGLLKEGVSVIACPMCGRAHGQVDEVAKEVQRALRFCRAPLTVAVMGCEINGPGEASRADIGIAASPKGWLFFSKKQKPFICPSKEGPNRLIKEALKLEEQWLSNGGFYESPQ